VCFAEITSLSHRTTFLIAVLRIGENPGNHSSVNELEKFDCPHWQSGSIQNEDSHLHAAVIRVPLITSSYFIRVNRVAGILDTDISKSRSLIRLIFNRIFLSFIFWEN
jgi:hypothetical protein